jgi:uncharacterized protein (TIGR02246 family)
MTDDEKAIHALVQRWMEATQAGDVDAVLSLMTDDVVFMVPGREPFGKEAFASMSRAMSGVEIDGKSEIVELQLHGDWAFLRNHLSINVRTPDGREMGRSGYTLTICRKEADGQWRLCRDANLVVPTG